ncbi:unnamed protein product [Schistosoma margrebowiei]|uniref:Uncharacterized protein n=1 Tax=Schistosoma margrebowiei TaxID=48269 RepID=A0A183N793_9TREM|nr:unnamed protein product [Schistosoma margrebowiei]
MADLNYYTRAKFTSTDHQFTRSTEFKLSCNPILPESLCMDIQTSISPPNEIIDVGTNAKAGLDSFK